MCGIAGFVNPATAPGQREAAVQTMCAAMKHRGPDDNGFATRNEATVGGCRLAIFDPANGHQPMASPDGRWTIVFNGAIYNFKELRAELAAGWTFQTDCDTEVLLAAFARWGTACLQRLRGMFAFAVWDDAARTLVLARDPFGIKPLYVHRRGAKLLFASELNALLASGAVAAEIDPQAVADYLAWFAVPAPRTIYRDIVSLRPGEFATFRSGELTIASGWTFSSIPAAQPCATYDDFVHALRARLEDTIRAHLLADVPVGAFLSGGLDSAAVVGLMTRVSSGPLRTFCIGFEETAYSEAASAEATARHFGARHHTHVLTGTEVARDLEKLLGALDQPTGDGVNTYYASQAARAGGVTVALSGLGGDELFGGYPSFRGTPRIARLLPCWRALPRFTRAAVIARLQRGSTRYRKLADMLQFATNIHEVGSLQRRVFSEAGRRSLLQPELLGAEPPFHPELAALAADLDGAPAFEVVSAWELRTYMADLLLRDSDVMSMRHSLELRVPFIDRPFIEWLWRQPQRTHTRRMKSALYDAVSDVVPAPLATRRKQGFSLPFPVWMRNELKPFLEDTFATESLARAGLFKADRVQALWRGFVNGHDTRQWSRVWSLAVLVAFINRPTRSPAARVASTPIIPARAPTRSPKPRTLLLAPEIYSAEGGIPRILQTYLSALCDLAGSERHVRLVALNDAPQDGNRIPSRLRPPLERFSGCRRNKLAFVRATLREARACDTIVCGHIRQLPVARLAQVLNRSLRYYLVAHGIEVWRPFGPAEKLALRGATRVFCISDYTRRELLKHCPLPDDRAIVLPNALDPAFAIEGGAPIETCEPVILVVTRLTYADRYKGVQHLIEAMPRIRAAIPGAILRIVGRGDDTARLQALCRDLGVTGAVEFTGYIDDARLKLEMQTCRLFALPSRKEGFGLVFLEAMAHGRPCLGANAGGVPEVITADTGVLVGYGDVRGIEQAAVDALQRPWDQTAILARAREFSFDAFKQRLRPLLAA